YPFATGHAVQLLRVLARRFPLHDIRLDVMVRKAVEFGYKRLLYHHVKTPLFGPVHGSAPLPRRDAAVFVRFLSGNKTNLSVAPSPRLTGRSAVPPGSGSA